MDAPPPPPPAPGLPEEVRIAKGMCFADQNACTAAMRKYAAKHRMTVKLATEHRGGSMLTYVCAGGEQCRFKVTALRSRRPSQSGYFINHCNLAHNMCVGRIKLTASQLRDDDLLRALVESDPSVSGRAIVEHVKRLRGGDLSIYEAYRARNLILDDLYGSVEESYRKLESLVQTWQRKNPTSLVDYAFDVNGEFVRAFIAHPYAASYSACGQKVAGVDGAFSQYGKHQSVRMVLVGRDGDNTNIVLGVAVCAAESEQNCEWFLRCCMRAVPDLNVMPLFADRESGIMSALEKMHVLTLRYCTRHIYESVMEEFKGKCPADMEEALYRVQAARNEAEYDQALNKLASTHPDIAACIRGIGPEHWVLCTALRSSRLYGWRSTNFTESQAASEPRQTLPFQFLQSYMEKLMCEAYSRREQVARSWRSDGHELTKFARDKLDEEAASAGYCTVLPSQPDVMLVHDTRVRPVHNRKVDIKARTCTCTTFDQYGIPCKHFIAALNFLKRPAERFTVLDYCYTIDAYSALYGAGAAAGIDLVLTEELTSNAAHHPPLSSSEPRKKKERLFPTRAGTKVRRTSRCTTCGQAGHNKRSCPSTEPRREDA
jgi:hypothetical protein